MKRFSKLAVVLLMLVGTFFGLAACNKVERIGIEKANMPRVTFVQGQELDLSGGKLTVKDKNGTKEIEFDTKGVDIKGYNKDQLGEQELTISYEGQKTTLKVTVVAQVVVENYEKNYFVKTEFNKEKGRLKITKDDASVMTVPMNDPNVTIEGFDSETAASPLTLTAKYTDENGAKYSGTFNVNIYNVENVDFHSPKGTDYLSHETTGIDLNGGYFTITANGGELTDSVSITENMISGFDLSKATEANMTEPLEQEITVTYGGKQYTYKIKITYSQVSLFKAKAAQFSSLDWTGEKAPVISETQGELAYELMQLYFGLTNNEKSYLTEEETLSVARTATVYGYKLWKEDVDQYADTFIVSDTGAMSLLYDSTYTGAKDVIEALQDTTKPIYTWGELLFKIAGEFSESVLIGEDTIGAKLAGVCGSEDVTLTSSLLKYMVALYEKLESVTEWSAETLANYDDALDSAIAYISKGTYKSAEYRSIYGIVNGWRENDDYFEMLYTYYYGLEDTDSINVIKDLYLPGELETLYETILTAIMQMRYSSSTAFMVYYYNAFDLAYAIVDGENEMYKSLYETLSFDGIFNVSLPFNSMLAYLRTADAKGKEGDYGYVVRSGALFGVDAYEEIWDLYVEIIRKSAEDDYKESVDYGADMQALFDAFVALSPEQQSGFLTSVSMNYFNGLGDFLALDFSDDGKEKTRFATDLAEYYTGLLSDEGDAVFADLLLAIEYYSIRYNKDDQGNQPNMINFLDKIKAVNSSYELLNEDDKAVFKEHFKSTIDKYTAYAALFDNEEHSSAVDIDALGDYTEDFEAILVSIFRVNELYERINEKAENRYYSPFFAAYEELEVAVKKMLLKAETAGDTDILQAYYHQEYETLSSPLAYFVYDCHHMYISMLTGLYIGDNMLYDYYDQDALQGFMANASSLFWRDEENGVSDKEKAWAAINGLHTLDIDDQVIFYVIDVASYSMYYQMAEQFFAEELASGAIDAAKKLLEVEQEYIKYNNDPEGKYEDETTYLQSLKDKMAELEEYYNDMLENDLDALVSFTTYLGDLYNYYSEAVGELE